MIPTKKILKVLGIAISLFLPFIVLSFLAHTVYHQIILLTTGLGAAWLAYFLVDLINERDRLSREVFFQAYELKKAKEALESCLVVDTQTRVYSERLLDSRLKEECDRSRRYQRPLSFLLVAVDSLQAVTEQYGSVLSGVVIQEVMQFLKENTRTVDIIIRYGEGRFVAILPETSLNSARVVAERIRYAIEKNTFRIEGKEIKITVSVGLVSFDSTIHRGKEDVLNALEQALQQAKKGGSNRVATVTSDSV